MRSGFKTRLSVPVFLCGMLFVHISPAWSQVVPWVCFGASETITGLVCINHQPPEAGQTDSYVSWPFQPSASGQFQEMTVFGFGRKGHKELIKHVPDLKNLPARFSVALVAESTHATASAAVAQILAAAD
ncbi:MAG: hypothetical protein HY000_18860 [Planctomycetes bacterium]|nr:hypothetical protein [Planctomycetota bacterium]